MLRWCNTPIATLQWITRGPAGPEGFEINAVRRGPVNSGVIRLGDFVETHPVRFYRNYCVSGGCNGTPQLRLESQTHGHDFVDENGDVLDAATSLDEICPTLNKPLVKSKLANSKLSVQFYYVSRRHKGFQVPDGITCQEIIETF